MENEKKKSGRRSFLQTSIAAGTLLSIPSITGAREGPREKFKNTVDASLKKRDQINDYDKWINHLRKRGLGVKSKGAYYRFGEDGGVPIQDDDMSSQSFPARDLETRITLVYDCNQDTHYGELAFRYDFSNGTGDNPTDWAAVAWSEDTWFLESKSISDTTRTSSFVYTDENTGFKGEGPGFEVYDSSVWYNGSENTYYYGGVYMRPADDSTSSDDRYIQGAYNHNWNSISVDVAVSAPAGLSVSPSNENYSWVTRTEDDQDTLLRMYESEHGYQNCGGIQS